MNRKFEVFQEEMTLEQIEKTLYDHLNKKSDIWVTDGRLEISILVDGQEDWYFTEMVKSILFKVKRGDADIVRFSIEQGIDLFRTTTELK